MRAPHEQMKMPACALLLSLLAAAAALRLPAAQGKARVRPITARADGGGSDDTAGVGFGGDAGAEERGRRRLEELRRRSEAQGFDTTLQGLEQEDEMPVEVPQEFKSKLTLGFAGFLIVGGLVSLLVGGSFYDDSNGNAPTEVAADEPAFGFAPKPTKQPAPESPES